MFGRRAVGFAVALGLVVAAASSSCSKSSSGAGLAGTCSINSDCNSPLVCAFSECHNQCGESRDCPSGERCVMSGTTGVCQLPAESMCAAGTPCEPGEVCGTDLQCRTVCTTAGGCVPADYCLTTGATGACYAALDPHDQAALITAGILAMDGAVISDASTAMLATDGSMGSSDSSVGPDGSSGPGTQDGSGSSGSDGGSSSDSNVATVPQTAFGSTAQGDSNPNFTSGVGVRTANKLLIFSGYAGGGDAGDAGTDNLVYVQAFDPTTANSLGSAQPLFAAPNGAGFALESASVAPTGQIALAFNYGGVYDPAGCTYNPPAHSLYGAFLDVSPDAGPVGMAFQKLVEIESGTIEGQSHITWSVATGTFVFSWQYTDSNGNFVGTKNFTPNGQAAGGTDPVPISDNATSTIYANDCQDQGSVATGSNFLGVALIEGDGQWLTILDPSGAQVGSSLKIDLVGANNSWVTTAATATGFVYVYDNQVTNSGSTVSEVFIPTSGDAGIVVPDAGDAGLPVMQGQVPPGGFTFTGAGAIGGHAISDNTGGVGGVGIALLYQNGLSFAYINADGTTHVGPTSVLPNTYGAGDQINIMNFSGSFGVSLYSAAGHSTQMAASGAP